MTLLRLARLAAQRGRSLDHYRAMQRYIAQASLDELTSRSVNVGSSAMLELGSGRGGYSDIFHEAARRFVASDLVKSDYFTDGRIPFVTVDVLRPFPLADAEFDVVYCSSLIEHVHDPRPMIRETWRVLRPGGAFLLSFPPFYSWTLIGGHGFKPYHLLGERIAVRMYNRKSRKLGRREVRNYADWRPNFGLHPLRIDDVDGLLREASFEVTGRWTRMSPVNTANLPGPLKDWLTWHVCYLARKPHTR